MPRVRQLSITVPKNKVSVVRNALEESAGTTSYSLWKADNSVVFQCYVPDSNTGAVLSHLDQVGCGVDWGYVAVLHVAALKPLPTVDEELEEMKKTTATTGLKNLLKEETEEEKLAKRAMVRLSIEEIYLDILQGTQITFDFLVFSVIAAIIAGIGLATDNTVDVVASMLVSPLMGPLLGVTFGASVRDKTMWRLGIKNELIGVGVTWFVGALTGLAFLAFGDHFDWPTQEMKARGTFSAVIVGLGFAIPSGAGVALAITGGGINSLVGVAISAALLPPIVNSGLTFTYGIFGPLVDADVDRAFYIEMSCYSMSLALMNELAIFAMGVLFFKLKAVAPVRTKSTFWEALPSTFRRGDNSTRGNANTSTRSLENLTPKFGHRSLNSLGNIASAPGPQRRSLSRLDGEEPIPTWEIMRAARKQGKLNTVLTRLAQERDLQHRALGMGIPGVGGLGSLTPSRSLVVGGTPQMRRSSSDSRNLSTSNGHRRTRTAPNPVLFMPPAGDEDRHVSFNIDIDDRDQAGHQSRPSSAQPSLELMPQGTQPSDGMAA